MPDAERDQCPPRCPAWHPRPATVMPTPAFWATLTSELWGLSAAESRRLWQALAGSRAPRPVSFRQQYALVGSGPGWNIKHFCRVSCSPQQMMPVLEALVAEHRLARGDASKMEEKMLQWLDATRAWR